MTTMTRAARHVDETLNGVLDSFDQAQYAPPAETFVQCAYCDTLRPESFMHAARAGERARHCVNCPRPVVMFAASNHFDVDNPFDLD